MNEHFVEYGKELLIANETQRNKIEFLERQRLKRDHYLSDLQENLTLNKQMLREYAQLAQHAPTLAALSQESDLLAARLRDYYQQYQSINASLLMEQQMRLSDKQFYEQRLIEFENKMAELRKYLHDKEDSFTSVILRLKRYEDLSEPPIQDKLHPFKKEIAERHINQFVAQLLKERNHYQRQCEAMAKHYDALTQLRTVLKLEFPEAAALIDQFEVQQQVAIDSLGKVQRVQEEGKKGKKGVEPHHELIRLVKKEKLNSQLLEDALADAIDKNEELVATNDLLQKNLDQLKAHSRLLKAENTIFALRLGQYDQHYTRVSAHLKRYYEQGEAAGLRWVTEQRLRQYAHAVEHFFGSSRALGKEFSQGLREDMERWSSRICDAREVKQGREREQLFLKSCSVPRLIVDFELDEQQGPEMIIDQF